jgi:hypothetical protein
LIIGAARKKSPHPIFLSMTGYEEGGQVFEKCGKKLL